MPVDPESDAGWYFSRARDLAAGNGYAEGGHPTAYWPVGYPAFLAALFSVFNSSVLVGQLANLVLAAATFPLLYAVAKQTLQSETAARLALLLLAVYPNNIAYVALLLTETLFTFLLLLATWLLLKSRGIIWLLAAGLTFGLATLVKSQTILLIVPVVVLAGWARWSWAPLWTGIGRSVVVLVAAAAVVAPWSWRNYLVFGEWVMVSTNGGMALLCGNNPSVVGDYWRDFSCDDPIFDGVKFSVEDQLAADRRARARAFQWIRDNPGDFVGMFPKKFFRLWAPDGEAEWAYQLGSPLYDENVLAFRTVRIANQVLYTFVLIAAAAMLVIAAIRGAPPLVFLGAAIAAVHTAVSLVFSGQSRYHFPTMPFLIMYAAWFAVWLMSARRQELLARLIAPRR
ncbi:MAG: glycosyltransferase family 39 protein [Sutterellaceae bacterium]|nr:glycosyltransferase family 39 protein [Burkholderiaceae bacterium]MDW8429688.1 glycosyltransferase family 39 protein [Sutterellaceae bacterium]